MISISRKITSDGGVYGAWIIWRWSIYPSFYDMALLLGPMDISTPYLNSSAVTQYVMLFSTSRHQYFPPSFCIIQCTPQKREFGKPVLKLYSIYIFSYNLMLRTIFLKNILAPTLFYEWNMTNHNLC